MMVPSAGPRPGSFDTTNTEHIGGSGDPDAGDGLPFVLVDVDENIIRDLVGANEEAYFNGAFTDRSAPVDMTIGVGDTIRITIFEAASGGLFVPTGGGMNNGNYVTLPDQDVDQTGSIVVPYAEMKNDGGMIKVAGRRTLDVQNDIQKRLMDKAIEPQVIVTLVKRTSNLFSIIGDVNAPGRFSISEGGERILDALGSAGGPKGADYNTLITLQRGAVSATARLSTVLNHPENNIYVQPSDVIVLKKEERYYNVLGATNTNSRVAFDAEKVTVADALAKAGGLNGSMAEPATVVVFRREEPKTLQNMGVKMEDFKNAEPIPTVYRINFTRPSGMFLAQKLQLRHNDVVYVSTHPFTDATKLLSALRDVLLIKLIDN